MLFGGDMIAAHDTPRSMQDRRETTVITDRGQTSIPATLRRELGLTQGQRLRWEKVSHRELRVSVMNEATPPGASSVLGYARRFRPARRRTREWMAELREGEK